MITKIEADYRAYRNAATAESRFHTTSIFAFAKISRDGANADMEIELTEAEQAEFNNLCMKIESRITLEIRDA